MSVTSLALLGFSGGIGCACAVLALMSGYFAVTRTLGDAV